MRKIQALVITLAMGATLAVSAAALTLNRAQNTNQNSEACCDMNYCCKDKDVSCCKKKKHGKNAHSCCTGKDGAPCCCKGDSCLMPDKKQTGNSNSN